MNSVGAVHFRSLAEAAAEQLRKAIVEGRLKPGQRLVEQKLATALGTSQPTVREALSVLENQGFVRKIANKGTYVTQLHDEDFRKILEVRLQLEGLAVERAAENMTPQAAKELSDLVKEMSVAAREHDPLRFHQLDMAFHQKIWKLAGNEYLQAALERLVFSLFAFVLVRQAGPVFLAAARQHRKILDGLCSGNADQARKALVRSTQEFWKENHHITVEIRSSSRSERGVESPSGFSKATGRFS